jgi:hypothetical protein
MITKDNRVAEQIKTDKQRFHETNLLENYIYLLEDRRRMCNIKVEQF